MRRIQLQLALAAAAAVTIFLIASPATRGSAEPAFCKPGLAANLVRAGTIGPAVEGVSVALKDRRLTPGETQYARLINRGESQASYSPVRRIERYVDSQWTLDPASPKGPRYRILYQLPPHMAGRCFHFVIPANQPAGIYRFVIPVKVAGARSELTSVFRIYAPASL